MTETWREELARRQEELVRALVGGGALPDGFVARDVGATRDALLRKRAGEVARVWPRLAASVGPGRWTAEFAAWAAGRPPQGSLRDGWDYAREHPPTGAAVLELAERELLWSYDSSSAPRPRRGLGFRRVGGVFLVRFRGRIHRWSR